MVVSTKKSDDGHLVSGVQLTKAFNVCSLSRARSLSSPSPHTDTDSPAPLDASVLALAEDFPAPPVYDASPADDKDDGKDAGRPRPRANLELAGKKDEGEGRKYPKWLKLGPGASKSFSSVVSISAWF